MPKDVMKYLKKEDFLKMLREQELEIDGLNGQIEALNGQIEALKQKLEESEATGRRLAWAELEDLKNNSDNVIGSIADSAIVVSGVFDSAQAAADKYLKDIRGIARRMENAGQEIEAEARERADEIIYKARCECERYESRKREMMDEIWNDLNARLDRYLEAHTALQEILGGKIELPRSIIQDRYDYE